jgi:hypothetical protein
MSQVKYRYLKEVRAARSSSDESKNLNGEVCLYTISVDNGAAGVYLKREQVYKIKTRVYGSYKKAFHVIAERIKETDFPEAVVRSWSYFGRSGSSLQSIVLEDFQNLGQHAAINSRRIQNVRTDAQ